MFAHIKFPYVKFRLPSDEVLHVQKGESFTVSLDEPGEGAKWATTADPVLNVVENSDATITVEVVKGGTSELQVQRNRNVEYHIVVEAFDPEEAVTLGATAGEPEPK